MKYILAIFLAGMISIPAKAQIPQPDPDTTALHFLTVASIGNLQEISAAKLALKKSNNPNITSFAKMMIQDHGQAEKELLQLATKRGYILSGAATGGIADDLQLVEAENKFDLLYVHKMVPAHNGTVQTFQNYAITGKDLQVRAFAQKTLPTLKAHLAEIKIIEKNISKSN